MSKDCELCGKPLDGWPVKPMESSDRAMLYGAVAALLACVLGGATCAWHKNHEEQLQTEQLKACLGRADAQTCVWVLKDWGPPSANKTSISP